MASFSFSEKVEHLGKVFEHLPPLTHGSIAEVSSPTNTTTRLAIFAVHDPTKAFGELEPPHASAGYEPSEVVEENERIEMVLNLDLESGNIIFWRSLSDEGEGVFDEMSRIRREFVPHNQSFQVPIDLSYPAQQHSLTRKGEASHRRVRHSLSKVLSGKWLPHLLPPHKVVLSGESETALVSIPKGLKDGSSKSRKDQGFTDILAVRGSGWLHLFGAESGQHLFSDKVWTQFEKDTCSQLFDFNVDGHFEAVLQKGCDVSIYALTAHQQFPLNSFSVCRKDEGPRRKRYRSNHLCPEDGFHSQPVAILDPDTKNLLLATSVGNELVVYEVNAKTDREFLVFRDPLVDLEHETSFSQRATGFSHCSSTQVYFLSTLSKSDMYFATVSWKHLTLHSTAHTFSPKTILERTKNEHLDLPSPFDETKTPPVQLVDFTGDKVEDICVMRGDNMKCYWVEAKKPMPSILTIFTFVLLFLRL